MIAKTRHRLNQLRQQPDHIRLRAAVTLAALIGTALTVISLAILLPLQLYLLKDASEPVTAQVPAPQVGGATNFIPTIPTFSAPPTATP